MMKPLFAICMLFFSANAYAESFFTNLGSSFKGAVHSSPELMLGLGVLLIIIIAVVVLIEIRKSDKFHKMKRAKGWTLFNEQVKSKKLNESEVELLKRILELADVTDASTVFSHALVFENAVDNFFNRQLPSETEIEELHHIRERLGYHNTATDGILYSTRQWQAGWKLFVRTQEGKTMDCQVEHVHESFWVVSNRLGEGDVLEGEKLTIKYVRQRDGEYQVVVPVVEVEKETITLGHTRDLERKQQRSWVRVLVNIKLEATIVRVGTAVSGVKKGDKLMGRLSDISGGGGQIKLPVKLTVGAELLLTFSLSQGVRFRKIQAIVRRVGSQALGRGGYYEHSLEFVELETQDREKIVRFIFDRQRQESQWR